MSVTPRRVQNPDYPDKAYSGLSVEEFILQNKQTWCYECGRVHGLTTAQIETLVALLVKGDLY